MLPCVHDSGRQTLHVANRHEATIYTVSDELFKGPNLAEHDGRAAGHRLQRRQGDGFISRRHRVHTAAAKKIAYLGTANKTMKPYARGQVQISREPLQHALTWPCANNIQGPFLG